MCLGEYKNALRLLSCVISGPMKVAKLVKNKEGI